jgi:hypothetical protein
MYTVEYYLVVPCAVRVGVAIHSSPKEAYRLAVCRAYDASAASGGCESIGVEGYTMWLDGKKIHSFCDI